MVLTVWLPLLSLWSLLILLSIPPEAKIKKFKFRAKHFFITPQRGICKGKTKRNFTLEKKKLLEKKFGMLN